MSGSTKQETFIWGPPSKTPLFGGHQANVSGFFLGSAGWPFFVLQLFVAVGLIGVLLACSVVPLYSLSFALPNKK